MKELIVLLPRNLETDKTFTENDGFMALTAVYDCPAFHGSPPGLLLAILCKKLIVR
jgi:hypothetical protein